MNEQPAANQWAAARGEKWRSQVAGMEATLTPVDQPLIRALRLDAPYRIADIGCGGGGTTVEILRQAPAGSVVDGFDISPALIESARTREGAGERDIVFRLADVATTSPPDGPYDRLASRFGIMFYDDPAAAFANLLTWLTRDGRFAFAVWSRPADNEWFTCVRETVADLVPVPSLDPDAPGPFRYADADKLIALLERAGFDSVEVHDWHGALPIGGGLPAADAAHFALAAFSSFDELLAAAGEAALNDARRSLAARFTRHQIDGAVRMEACVHIITGGSRGR